MKEFPEENAMHLYKKDDGLRYSREHLFLAFGAGVMMGLGIAISRKLRDIVSLAAVGTKIYSNFTQEKYRR